ncbi:MAG: hypothetical protein M1837_002987 [Sclerophora amabilis]|nr:MAG: hypothetical protein M1837_002987 [Sclerophora amabilis]
MDRISNTPEIFLRVIERTDIDTIFNLRLTNRATRTLIFDYEASIFEGMAEAFAGDKRLRLQPRKPGVSAKDWLFEIRRREDISWELCEGLDLRMLGRSLHTMRGMACKAYLYFDENLRDQAFMTGWRILWGLYDVTQAVRRSILDRSGQPQLSWIEVEEAILSQHLDYVDHLREHATITELHDYLILFSVLEYTYREEWRKECTASFTLDEIDRNDDKWWMSWFLLSSGPPFLERLFSPDHSSQRKQSLREIERKLRRRSPRTRRIEVGFAKKFSRELRRKFDMEDDFLPRPDDLHRLMNPHMIPRFVRDSDFYGWIRNPVARAFLRPHKQDK